MRRTRTWSTAVGASAVALSIGVVAAVPANGAEGAGAASARTVRHGTHVALEIPAGYLDIGLDATGTVTALKDSRTGKDYLAAGKAASLVSLVIDGRQVRPTEVRRSGWDGGLLTFTNKKAGLRIDVRVRDKDGYATLEAVRVDVPAGADAQTLLWGPLATSVTETVGESVGVVRDAGFAIGLRPLNDRTEGAWPQEYQQYGWEDEVENNPSKLQVAAHEEWSAAGRTPWGSVLRSFTYDYTKERERQNIGGYRIPVGPLPGTSGRITGSKVALFGATPEMAPTVLSDIAAGEGLPYPTQNGQWQKTAQASSQSFLVLRDLKTSNIAAGSAFAKAAGIDYIYSLNNSVGPWQSTGHYQFDSTLGSSDAGAAAAVDIAAANGVRLGVHTISDFISTNDPYVTAAPPDDRLATGGRAALTRPLTADDTTLYLDSGTLLGTGVRNRILRVGDEFIGYDAARQAGSEWEVTGLHRAQWSSAATAHAAGDRASRLVVNSYNGAIGGRGVIDEIATRLAAAWKSTGIMANSYDGVESASESGWGNYGQARLINGTYWQNAAKDGFVTETSRMTSNTWDALTRASWGEVGVTSMDQVYLNNAFYQDNFLPGMLGWIRLSGTESLQSVETVLARGAGLNAGAGFQATVAALTNSGAHGRQLLDAVRQWETARNLGAFTEAQRTRLRDRSIQWHLEVVTPGEKWSLQELDAEGHPVGTAEDVVTPAPRLSTTPLPAAATHRLYETRLTTNTPATVRFELTGGALPQGLRLNQDTGGITGTPVRPGTSTFTVTAHSTSGLPDAKATYRLTTRL